MLNICKKLTMAGLGLGEKLRTSFDDLVREGEANNSPVAEKIKKTMSGIEEKECGIKEAVEKFTSVFNVPSKRDFEELSKRIDEINSKLSSGRKES